MTQAVQSISASCAANTSEIRTRALFDFTNSGYATVVMATIYYGAYFADVIAGDADLIRNRPALSRWHPDYVEGFKKYMQADGSG